MRGRVDGDRVGFVEGPEAAEEFAGRVEVVDGGGGVDVDVAVGAIDRDATAATDRVDQLSGVVGPYLVTEP